MIDKSSMLSQDTTGTGSDTTTTVFTTVTEPPRTLDTTKVITKLAEAS
jgi:hypothetical protein